MEKYKLIALDIDGTTLNSKGKMTRENMMAIRNCGSRGINVCFCTGRNVKNTKKIATQFYSDMPFVCADGAVFYSTKDKCVILENTLSEYIIRTISEEVKKHDLYLEYCTKDYYFKYSKKPELEKFSYGGFPRNKKERLEYYFLRSVRYIKDLSSFLEIHKTNVNQIIIGGEVEELDKLKEFINKKEFDCDIRYDLWENYIFIVPKQCNKAHGLNMLANYFSIRMNEIIAIGDQLNDIDMIKKAGLGIAMGNAHERIKECADFVTKTNDESGVAFAINKFIN